MNHVLTFEELHKALKGKFAILSAENPQAVKQSDELNALATSTLELRLTNHRFTFTKIVGKYAGNTENSFLVLDMDKIIARSYGEFFKQESVLTNEGLVTPDGKVIATRNLKEEYIASGLENLPDNYSEVVTSDAGKVAVVIGLNF